MIEKVRVLIDVPESVLIEPPFSLERRGSCFEWEVLDGRGLHKFGGEIWENRPLWENGNDVTSLEVGKGFESIEVNWGLEGECFYQKQIRAGADELQGLENHENLDTIEGLEIAVRSKSKLDINRGFLFCLAVPGERVFKTDVLARVCFGGPSQKNHSGFYALLLRGNGEAELLSRLSSLSWESCGVFRFCAAGAVSQNVHRFYIRPFFGGGEGKVSIQVLSGDDRLDFVGICRKFHEVQQYCFSFSDVEEWKESHFLRMEVLGSIRMAFRLTALLYDGSTLVREGGFCLPFHPCTDELLYLKGSWNQESSGFLLSSKGVELKRGSEGGFTCFYPERGYCAEWRIEGKETSPGWIRDYWVHRNGLQRVEFPNSLELDRVESVEIIGADEEFGHEKGVLRFWDNGEVEERFALRGIVSICVQVQRGNEWVSIFRGFLERGRCTQLSSEERWSLWECKLVGMWKQLIESFIPN